MALIRLAKLPGAGLIDPAHTAGDWLKLMLQDADDASKTGAGAPPVIEVEQSKCGWPADDRWPKTPWR